MVSFKKILDPSCTAVNIDAKDRKAALAAAVDVLARGGRVGDVPRLLKEICARENIASTGIGEGVGIPHVLSSSVSETMLGILRLSSPVPYYALDEKPVDLLFIIAGPKGETSAHLKVLSKLARLLHDERFRASLRAAPDGESMARLLYEKD